MLNKAILIGRLTKDPELMQSKNGKKVIQFTLAVNRDKDNSDFIACVAWEKTAELIAQYFKKGSQLAVEGEIRTRSYDDKAVPNRKVYVTEVLVKSITFLESKKAEPQQQTQTYDDNPWDNPELPF